MALQDKLQKVLQAALNGPAIKNISIKGHEFNVDRVKREVLPDRVKIDGQGGGDNISHRQSWAFDDQVNYAFTVQVDEDGVHITNMNVSIKEGGLLNTWGAPIVAAIEVWDNIECIVDVLEGDSDKSLDDCDVLLVIKALVDAVTLDSSDIGIKDPNDVSIDDLVSELETAEMKWKEVAELMILYIAVGVVGREIKRQDPSWNPANKLPFDLYAPYFKNELVVGVRGHNGESPIDPDVVFPHGDKLKALKAESAREFSSGYEVKTALASGTLIADEGGFALTGLVSDSASDEHISFSQVGGRSWIDLPTEIIDGGELLATRMCGNHWHPIMRLRFRQSDNPLVGPLVALLSQASEPCSDLLPNPFDHKPTKPTKPTEPKKPA